MFRLNLLRRVANKSHTLAAHLIMPAGICHLGTAAATLVRKVRGA